MVLAVHPHWRVRNIGNWKLWGHGWSYWMVSFRLRLLGWDLVILLMKLLNISSHRSFVLCQTVSLRKFLQSIGQLAEWWGRENWVLSVPCLNFPPSPVQTPLLSPNFCGTYNVELLRLFHSSVVWTAFFLIAFFLWRIRFQFFSLYEFVMSPRIVDSAYLALSPQWFPLFLQDHTVMLWIFFLFSGTSRRIVRK